MDLEDSEKRIAELERQLAQQKRIAELERQLAEAKVAAGEARSAGPSPPFQAVEPVAERGLVGVGRGGFGTPGRRIGANRAGAAIGLIGGLFGICVGAAAAVTAVIPSSALWMGAIVCPSGYGMAFSTSHYSYKPGQSGTSVSFQCVSGDSAYDVNDFAVFGLQFLLVVLLVCVGGGLIWRLTRRRR
ncbi:MAG: hypothetical protein ACXVX1_06550 [Mycobacterium sp.]